MAPPLGKNAKDHDAVVKRVSRKHEEDDHGGSWKVAFADFCLALMCLFLVLWVLAARDKEELQHTLRDAGGNMVHEGAGKMPDRMGGPRGSLISREPMPSHGDTLAPRKTPANSSEIVVPDQNGARLAKTRYETAADMRELARAIAYLSEKAGLAANMQTILTPYGLRVMVHDTDGQGMFERGSAAPTAHFARLLREMGPLFAQIDNQVLIVGHTDSLQYAGGDRAAYSNWTLSSNRAMTARTQLMLGGMPPRSVLQVAGMADRGPLDPGDAAAAKNRRIEMLILTSGQAAIVAEMFGTPAETSPLIDGVVDSALPDRNAIEWLRGKLRGVGIGLERQ
ncbi:MAG: flagellar motor protein MotB [Aromatoleum sp.]|jgi:chemotaxis protein MotB|uniref:flagellar motor protein MotB n=1 Tax=Aromatoleum sp. TaxID=2307007 RepID=UPI0028939656|nr:flagellar motor protein MotB [Aromatoleum sp.]MDT3671902.1 flagellar motor protein MotB [Aromatoleum sp.]